MVPTFNPTNSTDSERLRQGFGGAGKTVKERFFQGFEKDLEKCFLKFQLTNFKGKNAIKNTESFKFLVQSVEKELLCFRYDDRDDLLSLLFLLDDLVSKNCWKLLLNCKSFNMFDLRNLKSELANFDDFFSKIYVVFNFSATKFAEFRNFLDLFLVAGLKIQNPKKDLKGTDAKLLTSILRKYEEVKSKEVPFVSAADAKTLVKKLEEK